MLEHVCCLSSCSNVHAQGVCALSSTSSKSELHVAGTAASPVLEKLSGGSHAAATFMTHVSRILEEGTARRETTEAMTDKIAHAASLTHLSSLDSAEGVQQVHLFTSTSQACCRPVERWNESQSFGEYFLLLTLYKTQGETACIFCAIQSVVNAPSLSSLQSEFVHRMLLPPPPHLCGAAATSAVILSPCSKTEVRQCLQHHVRLLPLSCLHSSLSLQRTTCGNDVLQ